MVCLNVGYVAPPMQNPGYATGLYTPFINYVIWSVLIYMFNYVQNLHPTKKRLTLEFVVGNLFFFISKDMFLYHENARILIATKCIITISNVLDHSPAIYFLYSCFCLVTMFQQYSFVSAQV